MSEKFIDDLYQELEAERRAKRTSGASAEERLQDPPDALSPWWDAFAVRLGDLVGAWNEKTQSAPPVTFTRTDSRAIVMSHPHVHAEWRLEDDRITRTMQVDSADAVAGIINLHLDERGGITALIGGKSIASPGSAAEEAIRPILINSFRR